MASRIIIAGRNSEISATAFQTVGRGLASQGGSACRRSTGKDNRGLGVHSDLTSRGGRPPQGTPAADLCFWFLCLLIFVAAPVWMVVA